MEVSNSFSGFLLRAFPFLCTVFVANYMHYSSLLYATRQAKTPGKDGSAPRPIPSYKLMKSQPMRNVRYWIKLVRYTFSALYILAVFPYIPELADFSLPRKGILVAVLFGLVSGIMTITSNENSNEQLRTLWQPAVDFRSAGVGKAWDALRFIGSVAAVPFEEELVYRAWLYRFIICLSSGSEFKSFQEVPFSRWSWQATIICILVSGFMHGNEWKSASLSGFLFQVAAVWIKFPCAVLAHACADFLVGIWVLATGQRQYW